MPTVGPFKDILAKGDLVDSATGFANVFVVNIFLVFELQNCDGNCPACKMVHIDTIDTKFVPSVKNFSCSRKDINLWLYYISRNTNSGHRIENIVIFASWNGEEIYILPWSLILD